MVENKYPFKKDHSYNTMFGKALIKLGDKYQKISPPRDINGAELLEYGYPIIEFKIENIDFIEKINLTHIKFMFIDNTSSNSNSYSPECKTIFIVNPIKEIQGSCNKNRESCFINSVLHEVGHAVLHPNGAEKNLEIELDAWLHSIKKSHELFGPIKKEELKILEKHIITDLESYCNN